MQWKLLALAALVFGGRRVTSCAPTTIGAPRSVTTETASTTAAAPASIAPSPVKMSAVCDGKAALRVHFYDVAQGLAALVDLPDGRHILVDAGDAPKRSGCDEICAKADAHLLQTLARDLHGDPIAALWLTHPHSDHVGGAPEVLDAFTVENLVDNGRDVGKPTVEHARAAASRRGTNLHVVEPGRSDTAFLSSALPEDVLSIRAIVPDRWMRKCRDDENDCSIGLRIDYCQSSVLFVGDAEHDEEKALASTLDALGPVTLLQVGHHGSDTSSGDSFLKTEAPRYAVVSAGKPDEGLNAGYCHPRLATIEHLSQRLGGTQSGTLRAYDGEGHCRAGTERYWRDVKTSERLFATERDGDVVLTSYGDGKFSRE